MKVLCDESPDDPDYAPPLEESTGGYYWGAGGGANPGAENNRHNIADQNIGDNNNVLHSDENQNLQKCPHKTITGFCDHNTIVIFCLNALLLHTM